MRKRKLKNKGSMKKMPGTIVYTGEKSGNEKINIETNFPIKKIAIYTMSGSKIYSFEGNGAQEIEENFVAPTGIYIVIINNKVTVKTINKK